MRESEELKREVATLLNDVFAFLESFRVTSWLTMITATSAFVVVLVGSHFIAAAPIGRMIDDMHAVTNGWITPQLVYPMISLGLVWLAFFRIGHLRCSDVGWRASSVIPAAVTTVGFWMCIQGSLWLRDLVEGQEPTWTWRWRGQGSVLAALNAQLIGNSLTEETLFRGCLLPQLYLRLARVTRRSGALAVALLAPLALSVVIHLPRLVDEEELAGASLNEALFWTLRFGLLLSLVFLVTKNLFLCVGLHSLWNARPVLIAAPWQNIELAWWVWTTLLLMGWSLISNSRATQSRQPPPTAKQSAR